MKPIGLVTCYYVKNYGSALQAYATERIIDKMKMPFETINCVMPRKYMKGNRFLYVVKKLLIADFDKKKRDVYKLYYRKKYADTYGRNVKIRYKKFDEFVSQHFHLSERYLTRDDLEKSAFNYSAFLVGSDQLWRTDSVEHGYYTLEWVPDNIRKIAYSTSIGVKKIPWFQKAKNRRFMQRFDYVALREQSACDLFEQMTGKKVHVVLDPVLLLTKEDWMAVQPTKPVFEGEYIFCYLLGNNVWQRKFVQEVKNLTGLKIVAIVHMDEYIPFDNRFADETPYDIGPGEFVNCIQNAKYVFTDSFHCTAFSILFHKNFYTFNRFSDNAKQSTNTRIDNLLNIMNLENRRVYKGQKANEVLNIPIDYSDSQSRLEKYKEFSLSFLHQALKLNDD